MKSKQTALSVLFALVIAACVPTETPAPLATAVDVSAIRTSAARTVIAEISSTAAAAATLEPSATLAPSPTVAATLTATLSLLLTPGVGTQGLLCDDFDYGFPLDVNFPDGSEVTVGQVFIKTWKIRNTGACSWGPGYQVIYGYGDKLEGKPVALTSTIIPGQEVEVSVQFKAPAKAGEYKSWWRMANASASPFGFLPNGNGRYFSVWIIIR